MTKPILFFILCSLCLTIGAQEDTAYKTLLDVHFTDNTHDWHIENSRLRKAKIKNGQLIDWVGENGKLDANIIQSNINPNKDFIIEFSISNLNNKPDKKYPVYSKGKNKRLEKNKISNPTWGFTWGFKDWKNYNAIVFRKNSWINCIEFKIYTVSNGIETAHTSKGGWDMFFGYKIQTGTKRNLIRISKTDDDIFILNTLHKEHIPIGLITNTVYHGNGMGPLISYGSKIALDSVSVRELILDKTTAWTKESLLQHWNLHRPDSLEGIYKSQVKASNHPCYELAVVKTNGDYQLIYLSGAKDNNWKPGDIKAYQAKTTTTKLFQTKWFMGYKALKEGIVIKFEHEQFKVCWPDKTEHIYQRQYPKPTN